MKLSHDLIVRILKWVPVSDDGNAGMYLIVKRPYDHLLQELHGVFGEQSDIVIKIDNRQEERRSAIQPSVPERRQRNRRTEKVTLLELILTT